MDRKDLDLARKYLESEQEVFGCRGINPAYCRTCIFSRGAPPFADGPEKAYCDIYDRETTNGKPPEVYYDGEECEFYEPSDN